MKKLKSLSSSLLLTIILLISLSLSFTSYTQSESVNYTSFDKSKDGKDFVIFQFENTSNKNIYFKVKVKYMYKKGKYLLPSSKIFTVALSPNETYKGNLSFTTKDNNMILDKNPNGELDLHSYEVIIME